MVGERGKGKGADDIWEGNDYNAGSQNLKEVEGKTRERGHLFGGHR